MQHYRWSYNYRSTWTSIQRLVCYLPTDFGLLFGQQKPVSVGSAEWTLLLVDLASFNSQKSGITTLERSTVELLGINLKDQNQICLWQKHVKPSLEATGPLLTCFSWSTITALSFIHPQLLHLLLQRLHQAPLRILKWTLKHKHVQMCSWTIALNCCSWYTAGDNSLHTYSLRDEHMTIFLDALHLPQLPKTTHFPPIFYLLFGIFVLPF